MEKPPRPTTEAIEAQKAEALETMHAVEHAEAHRTPGALKTDRDAEHAAAETQYRDAEYQSYETKLNDARDRIIELEQEARMSDGIENARDFDAEIGVAETRLRDLESKAPGVSESRREWREKLAANVQALDEFAQERFKSYAEEPKTGMQSAEASMRLTPEHIGKIRARLRELHAADYRVPKSGAASIAPSSEKAPAPAAAVEKPVEAIKEPEISFADRVAQERAQLEAEAKETRKGPLNLTSDFESPERRAAREQMAEEKAKTAYDSYRKANANYRRESFIGKALHAGELNKLKAASDAARRGYVHEKTWDKKLAERSLIAYKYGAEPARDRIADSKGAESAAFKKGSKNKNLRNTILTIAGLATGIAAVPSNERTHDVVNHRNHPAPAHRIEAPKNPVENASLKPVTVTIRKGEGAEALLKHLQKELVVSGQHSTVIDNLIKAKPTKFAESMHFIKDGKSAVLSADAKFTVTADGKLVFENGKHSTVLMSADVKGTPQLNPLDTSHIKYRAVVPKAAKEKIAVHTGDPEGDAKIPELNREQEKKAEEANSQLKAQQEEYKAKIDASKAEKAAGVPAPNTSELHGTKNEHGVAVDAYETHLYEAPDGPDGEPSLIAYGNLSDPQYMEKVRAFAEKHPDKVIYFQSPKTTNVGDVEQPYIARMTVSSDGTVGTDLEPDPALVGGAIDPNSFTKRFD